jgi:hypothetical protein
MNFLIGLLLDLGSALNLFGLRAQRDRVARECAEEQAEWEAFVNTCRRRDHELFGRAGPGYAEELYAARQRHGLA